MTSARRIGLLCGLALSVSAAAQAQMIRTVALSGQQAPGLPDGVVFENFTYALLNASGQVAFSGDLVADDLDGWNGRSVWSEGSGSLELVARVGGQVPDMSNGVSFTGFGDFAFSSGGQTAIPAGIDGPGVDSSNGGGIWSGTTGALQLIIRVGDHAPGTPSGVTFSFDTDPPVNSSGETAILAEVAGSSVNSSNNEGIWSGGPGSFALVARAGDQAPGAPSDVNFRYFGHPAINSAGQVAFDAALTGSRGEYSDKRGIWLADSGSLTLVARTGEPAPGTPSGVTFDWVGWDAPPVLNSAGETAFSASLLGSGVDSSNDHGIWSGVPGALDLVVRAGDKAPDTSEGVNFSEVFDPVLNSAGQTAFFARVSGSGVDSSNDEGIWSEGSGTLALVAREGDHAPGTPIGVYFDSLGNFPALNSAGQTVFHASLGGSGVGPQNDYSIWAQDKAGSLRLIVREGDPLRIAPGDYRTVERVRLACCSGSDEGHFNPFNEPGQLAFHASFTDGSEGIFVSNLGTVPEPNSLLLFAIAIIALLAKSSRACPGRHAPP